MKTKNNELKINIINDNKSLTGLQLASLIVNVFNVFVNIKNEDRHYNDDLRHVKLQKIMWFSYLDCLKETDIALVNEDFQAWKYGPVLMTVFQKYKEYKSKLFTTEIENINNDFKDEGIYISKKQLQIIIHNCVKYKNISSMELSDLSHDDFWKQKYTNGEGTYMNLKDVRKYYINAK